MRVGVLTREYPPEVYGGAGVHVEYLTRELAHQVEVAVHCFGERRELPLVAAAYRPWAELLEKGRPEDAALGVMSVDLAMARDLGGVDLVHSHTWYANLAGHLAKLLWDVPHVCTTHSLEPLRPWKAEQLGGGYALSLFCERTALLAADAVITVSEAMRADLLGCYPAVDPGRVHVIHNGIDAEEYLPDRGTPPCSAAASIPAVRWSSSWDGSPARRGSPTFSVPRRRSTAGPSSCWSRGPPTPPRSPERSGRSTTRRSPRERRWSGWRRWSPAASWCSC